MAKKAFDDGEPVKSGQGRRRETARTKTSTGKTLAGQFRELQGLGILKLDELPDLSESKNLSESEGIIDKTQPMETALIAKLDESPEAPAESEAAQLADGLAEIRSGLALETAAEEIESAKSADAPLLDIPPSIEHQLDDNSNAIAGALSELEKGLETERVNKAFQPRAGAETIAKAMAGRKRVRGKGEAREFPKTDKTDMSEFNDAISNLDKAAAMTQNLEKRTDVLARPPRPGEEIMPILPREEAADADQEMHQPEEAREAAKPHEVDAVLEPLAPDSQQEISAEDKIESRQNESSSAITQFDQRSEQIDADPRTAKEQPQKTEEKLGEPIGSVKYKGKIVDVYGQSDQGLVLSLDVPRSSKAGDTEKRLVTISQNSRDLSELSLDSDAAAESVLTPVAEKLADNERAVSDNETAAIATPEKMPPTGQPEVGRPFDFGPPRGEGLLNNIAAQEEHKKQFEAEHPSPTFEFLNDNQPSSAEKPPAAERQLEPTVEAARESAPAGFSDSELDRLFDHIQPPAEGSDRTRTILPAPENIPVADLDRRQAEALRSEAAAENAAPDTASHLEAQIALREYTKKRGIAYRVVGRRLSRLDHWADRLTGKGAVGSEKGYLKSDYDLLGRAIVRTKNFFMGKIFDHNSNSAMKAEGRISELQMKMAELEAENSHYKEVRDNPDLPYKERKHAAKMLSSGVSRYNSLAAQEAKQTTKLNRLEGLKDQCLKGISERSLKVSSDIEERISPLKAKLEQAQSVLSDAEEKRAEAAADRGNLQSRYENLKIKLLSVSKENRPMVKAALASCKKELAKFDAAFRLADSELNSCKENISHLESLINPWEDMAKMYQDMAKRDDYVSAIKKPAYSSTIEQSNRQALSAARTESPAERIAENGQKVPIGRYLDELGRNLGYGEKPFTPQEIRQILGPVSNPENQVAVEEVERRVRPILANRLIATSRVNGILAQARALYQE